MAIVRQYESQRAYPTPYDLLIEMASRRDMDRLPDALTGGLMRAILTGALYPEGAYAAVLERIRAGGEKDRNGNPLNPVNYARASMIKAALVRKARILNNSEEECLTMSLNTSATDIGYRLGRLFAVLEKAQQDANPGINTTIRDSYFATASASPGAVFPILIRLAQHHIRKSDFGFVSDLRIQDVLSGVETFPPRLDVDEQGRFILGYYHQRQDLYTKKAESTKEEENHVD
jgi:CRISPR-associated protein Csd1